MAEVLAAAFSAKFPDGLPSWIDPFLKAARRLEILEKREQDGKTVTGDNEPKGKVTKKKKKRKTSRKGKGKEVSEQDEGLADDVEDAMMVACAEEFLETAIELSNEEEALPFTWMAVLHMKKEKWPVALENARKAAELEPFCPTILFRLSALYGQEKQFVQAHIYYERALALLPLPEKLSYLVKLERLKEQSEDEKANIFRVDPFDVLPLEVIINIMRFGLEDPNFVFVASGVNRRWRTVLNHSCPELWKTWTFSHKDLQGKAWQAKKAIWVERAGTDADAISLKDFTMAAVDKIKTILRSRVKEIKSLEVQARNSSVVDRIALYMGRSGGNVVEDTDGTIQHLRIDGGRFLRSTIRSYRDPGQTITCGIQTDIENIHTLELSFVDFHLRSLLWWDYQSTRTSYGKVSEPTVTQYPGLKRLVVVDCAFDHVYAVSTAEGTEARPIKYQADVLHTTLRGSSAIEHLEITYNWHPRMPEQACFDQPITLTNLSSAILPPPSIWRIDIAAPNLESIAFKLPLGFKLHAYDRLIIEEQLPMIPAIADTPVSNASLSTLKSAEFACYTLDDISRLELWVFRLSSITKLVIRNAANTPYPPADVMPADLDDRTSFQAVRMLRGNPEWCPALVELELEKCLASGKTLVEYVRLRTRTAGCAALEGLTLKKCSKLSEKAKLVLTQEISCFVIKEEFKAAKYMMNRYIDDNFDVVASEEQE